MERRIFMLDVESDGLYGSPIAAGFVAAVIRNGKVEVVEKRGFKLSDSKLNKVKDNWVRENVVPGLLTAGDLKECATLNTMLIFFYQDYIKYKKEGFETWGDCIFPVEANFMKLMIEKVAESIWDGPYPFYDLATLLDVNVSREEFSGVKYDHTPVNDALASVYSLAKVLSGK